MRPLFARSEEVELLEIRWQGLRDLLGFDDGLKEHIDQIYRDRALESHMREIPFLKHLSDEDLKRVMDETIFETYGDYDWYGEYRQLVKAGPGGTPRPEPIIAEEGNYPNGVVLIRAGFARVSRKFGHGHRTLNYLGAGQEYGFREIAHNWRDASRTVPLQYTLRVIGYTHILLVPTAIMESIVLPSLPVDDLPDAVSPEEEPTASRPIAPAARGMRRAAATQIPAETLEFLTENRFFNGTATMVIDLDRCTRCDDCVRACADTHDGNPRFLRHGPISDKLMIADACMHCVDPVCMIGCPTGAIHRSSYGGQVVINPATCIGCSSCANNCPYDAIRMVEIRDRESRSFMADVQGNPIMKATKCDLCIDQPGGPACQQACPHTALTRMNMNDLDALVNWLHR